jgi:hypothetical protein
MPSLPLTSANLSDFEKRIQETLRFGEDPCDTADAEYLLAHGIRLSCEPLYHVGAAYDLKNRKIIRVDTGIRSAVDQAALVAHELMHLRQGIPLCFLLTSEIEAWQRQWDFLRQRTGRWWWESFPGRDAALLRAFMDLPASVWTYLLPDALRIGVGRVKRELRWFPAGYAGNIRAVSAFPFSCNQQNRKADTARRAMKSVDTRYLANLLFPWPWDWLWNRDFWKDAAEGLARIRQS